MNVLECLELILQSKKRADVCFLVGEKEERVEAHSFVLTLRSEVFAAMFSGNFKESSHKEIKLSDVDRSSLEKFLRFLYTDKVNITDDVFSLIDLATKYQVQPLVTRCCEFFNNQSVWNEQTVFTILNGAFIYNQSTVKEKALNYITQHRDIISHPNFNTLRPEAVASIAATWHGEELPLVRACLTWVEEYCKRLNKEPTRENKRDIMKDILPHLNFGSLEPEDIFSIVRPANVLSEGELLDIIQQVVVSKKKPPPSVIPLPHPNTSWTILLKCANGTTFNYDANYWTTPNTLNEKDSTTDFTDAKYPAFNTLPISELFLIADNKRWVHLKLPEKKPLLEYFTSGKAAALQHIAGSKTPTELAGSDTPYNYATPVWRIQSTGTQRLRIGGWFSVHWAASYGHDGIGPCSAEWAGLGINDKTWSPYSSGAKSFGIRTAHDLSQSDGKGNISLGIHVYGR